MRKTLLWLKIVVYGYLAYLLYVLACEYDPTSPAFRPPMLLWIADWMNLYMHEAGHLIFKIFGRTFYFLGGSLTQILLPLALVAVIARQRDWYIGAAGFWLGENMVNVSAYISDAPYKKLHLIGRGLIHDWNWLLSDDLELAPVLGSIVLISGIAVCAVSIGTGVYLSVRDFRWQTDSAPDDFRRG